MKVPFASHGRGCPYYYSMDVPFGLQLAEQWGTEAGFNRWAEEWIFKVDDWDGYCRKIGVGKVDPLAEAERRYQQYGKRGKSVSTIIYAQNYSLMELMAAAIAREFRDQETAFVGVGPPLIAAMVANLPMLPT
ncbi:MAG: hypothetical protein ACOX2B_10460 [Syntrophothermaceae bacterium]